MNPRRAALTGILFVLVAALYFAFPSVVDPSRVDFAGLTMLIALGGAMSIMAYVLFASVSRN